MALHAAWLAIACVLMLSSLVSATPVATVERSEGLRIDSQLRTQSRASAGGSPSDVHVSNQVRLDVSSTGSASRRVLTGRTHVRDAEGRQHVADVSVTVGDPRDTYDKVFLGFTFAVSGSLTVAACEDRQSRLGSFVAQASRQQQEQQQDPGGPGTRRRLLQQGSATTDPCTSSALGQDTCNAVSLPLCRSFGTGGGLGGEQVCEPPNDLRGIEAAIRDTEDEIEIAQRNAEAALDNVTRTIGGIVAGAQVARELLDDVFEQAGNTANVYDVEVQGAINETQDALARGGALLSDFETLLDAAKQGVAEGRADVDALIDEARAQILALQSTFEDDSAALAALLERSEQSGVLVAARIGLLNEALQVRLQQARQLVRLLAEVYRDSALRRVKARKLSQASEILRAHGLRVFESACDPPLPPTGFLPLNIHRAGPDVNVGSVSNTQKEPFLTLSFTFLTSTGLSPSMATDYDVLLGGTLAPEFQGSYDEATGVSGALFTGIEDTAALLPTKRFVNFRRISFFGDNSWLLDNRDGLNTAEDVLRMVGPAGCTPLESCRVWAVVERQRCLAKEATLNASVAVNSDPQHAGATVGIESSATDMGQFCALPARPDSALWFSPAAIVEPDGAPIPGAPPVPPRAQSISGRWQLEPVTSAAALQDTLRQMCSVEVLQLDVPSSGAPIGWFAAKASTFARDDPQLERSVSPSARIVQSVGGAGLPASVGAAMPRCGQSPQRMSSETRAESVDPQLPPGDPAASVALGPTLPFWVSMQLRAAARLLATRAQVQWELTRDGSVSREASQRQVPFFVSDPTLGPYDAEWRASDVDAFLADRDDPMQTSGQAQVPVSAPPPGVKRCGVATVAYTGQGLVPIYSFVFRGTEQTAQVTVATNGTLRYSSTVSIRQEGANSGVSSSLPASFVSAGFLNALVRPEPEADKPPDESVTQPGGDQICYDTHADTLSMSRETSDRCHKPDFLAAFFDADVDGFGVGTRDSHALRRQDSAALSDATRPQRSLPPPFMAPLSADAPLGVPGVTPVFGADQWHAQERRRDFPAACASSSLRQWRRRIVRDTRWQTDAPLVAGDEDDEPELDTSRADARVLAQLGPEAYQRGGWRCSPEDVARGASGAMGVWCSILETHEPVALDAGINDLDSEPQLTLRQKEWRSTVTLRLPGELFSDVQQDVSACPPHGSVRIDTPSASQAQVVVTLPSGAAGAASQAFTLVVQTEPVTLVLGGSISSGSCSSDSQQQVRSGVAPGSTQAFPLPFCQALRVTVRAARAGEEQANMVTCWTWEGNMTALWTDRQARVSSEPYSGQVDQVSTDTLTADATGPTPLSGSGGTIPLSALGAALRDQALGSTAAASVQTVQILRDAVLQARELVRLRRSAPNASARPGNALEQSMAEQAMDMVDTLTWLRRSLLVVGGHFADELPVAQGGSSGSRVEEFAQALLEAKRKQEAANIVLNGLRDFIANQSEAYNARRDEFRDRLGNLTRVSLALNSTRNAALPSPDTVRLAQDNFPPGVLGPTIEAYQRRALGPLLSFLKEAVELGVELAKIAFNIIKKGIECVADAVEAHSLMGCDIVSDLLHKIGLFLLVATLVVLTIAALVCVCKKKAVQGRLAASQPSSATSRWQKREKWG